MMGMFGCSIPEHVLENSGSILCKKEQGQRSSLLKDGLYSFYMQVIKSKIKQPCTFVLESKKIKE
jgi:23S rRNA U2552 (ribose-2'-O)-methylase RlmE/FtsJ